MSLIASKEINKAGLSALKGLNGELGSVTLVYGVRADLERSRDLGPRPSSRSRRRHLVPLAYFHHVLQGQHTDEADRRPPTASDPISVVRSTRTSAFRA